MKFIVDRKTWYRGKTSEVSCLLREDGMRCCIGFVGSQCGLPDSSLLRRDAVMSNLSSLVFDEPWPKWMKESADIRLAYVANDSIKLTDSEREDKLKEIFLRNGDEIEFIN